VELLRQSDRCGTPIHTRCAVKPVSERPVGAYGPAEALLRAVITPFSNRRCRERDLPNRVCTADFHVAAMVQEVSLGIAC